ncbi:hypothetical protein DFH11DRAFT_1603784 [Phellopilus nigrolimitatus]|nr:hypothetical protein DFH11DRAFT_1603784 [Phellopilus nigrolimitatus]
MSYSFSDPPISRWDGLRLVGLISSSYVVSIYISLLFARPRPPLWRNDPAVIKARSVMASLSSILCCAIVHLTIKSNFDEASNATYLSLKHLGLSTLLSLPSFEWLRAHLIVPALFLGPLYATFLSGTLPFQQSWDFHEDFVLRISTWEGFRNHVMAPITEEITYRACVLSVYKLSGYSKNAMIWVAPCWFGTAHIHHAFETYKRLGKTADALRTALLSTVFQFIYTTVFGWLCSFLFIRTGSVSVPIIAHMFCNIMGFPDLTWELKEHPSRKLSIIFAYFSGVALFCYTLSPWSFNPDSFYWQS